MDDNTGVDQKSQGVSGGLPPLPSAPSGGNVASPPLKSDGAVPDLPSQPVPPVVELPVPVKEEEVADNVIHKKEQGGSKKRKVKRLGKIIGLGIVVLSIMIGIPYVVLKMNQTSGDIRQRAAEQVTIGGVCTNKMLAYSLQPAGTSTVYEDYGKNFVSIMNNNWSLASKYPWTFANRRSVPVITLSYLSDYAVVFFENGCGGATGLFSEDELEAIKQYHLNGGHIVLQADDALGDSNVAGGCQSRVNQIASRFTVKIDGTGKFTTTDNPYVCASIDKEVANSPLFYNIPSLMMSSPGIMNYGAYGGSPSDSNWGSVETTLPLDRKDHGGIACGDGI